MVRKSSFIILIALIVLACPAASRADPIVKFATLSGSQEVPPRSTMGTGYGFLSLNDAETAFTVFETFSGLTTPATGAHIHVAPAGANGPIIFDFFPGFPAATSGTFSRVLTAANLIPRPAAGINTFADAVTAFKNDRLYFNIHTPTYPGGEIRGQIVNGGLPEPGTIALFLVGGAGLAVARLRRRR